MLAIKLDLLIKRLDEHATTKGATYGTIQSLYSHIPCKVCENFRHSGNDCLESCEDVQYNNYNGFYPQGDPGWNQSHPQYQEGNYAYSNFSNQPSPIDLVLGQAQINENLTNKLASNDKNINSNSEGLTFYFTN